jgi:hypothetical protein
MGGEFLAQTSGSESGVTEHDVTLLVPGDIESVRRRLPEALERFGYRVLSEQPLQARRKAQGWGRGSNNVLDQRTTVLINLKPSGKRATRVTFDYTVDHPWLTRGDLQTLEREGEAIVALAKLRVESSTCPECGTEAIADSRFCRQCGTPLAKSQPSEIEVFRVTAGARAGYQNIVGGAILLVVSCLPASIALYRGRKTGECFDLDKWVVRRAGMVRHARRDAATASHVEPQRREKRIPPVQVALHRGRAFSVPRAGLRRSADARKPARSRSRY